MTKTHEALMALAHVYDATCMQLCPACGHGICSRHQPASGMLAAYGILYLSTTPPREPEGCCRAAVDSEGNRHDHEEWKRLLDEASCIIIEAMATLGSEHPVFWMLDDFDGSGDALARRDAATRLADLRVGAAKKIADDAQQQLQELELERIGLINMHNEVAQKLHEVEIKNDELVQENDTQRRTIGALQQRVSHVANYRLGNKCRSCGQQPGQHRMYCRLFEGEVTHAWLYSNVNGTFSGLDWICSCGKSIRVGGIAGLDPADGNPPPCPNGKEVWRGRRPEPTDQGAESSDG